MILVEYKALSAKEKKEWIAKKAVQFHQVCYKDVMNWKENDIDTYDDYILYQSLIRGKSRYNSVSHKSERFTKCTASDMHVNSIALKPYHKRILNYCYRIAINKKDFNSTEYARDFAYDILRQMHYLNTDMLQKFIDSDRLFALVSRIADVQINNNGTEIAKLTNNKYYKELRGCADGTFDDIDNYINYNDLSYDIE